MAPYQATVADGSGVRIRSAEALAEFQRAWRWHHPLTQDMSSYAGQVATVEEVGFYHGGDPLYRLRGLPGSWHESCLEPV